MAWYEADEFTRSVGVPAPLRSADLAGPQGLALVSVFKNGTTTPGWGLTGRPAQGGKAEVPGFMEGYAQSRFWAQPRLEAYRTKQSPFAFVMRSVRVVCLDIDRHTDGDGPDGYTGVLELGELPPTLAETSKSGAGRHLFYRVEDDWHDELGFGRYGDAIGLAPGVDLRSVGCVYHYPSQRWNTRALADIPEQLHQLLEMREMRKSARHTAVAAIANGTADDTEVLIMHDTLLNELAKPIKPGTRNTSLFAMGSQMKEAQVPGWEEALLKRAEEVGLPDEEAQKIVDNVNRYQP